MQAATDLKNTIEILRSPQGCSWDRQLTFESLARYLIEETNEVVEAIDSNRPQNLQEELGDLLSLLFMVCEIAEGAGQFSLEDVLQAANRKLIARHPHVFEAPQDLSPEEVLEQFHAIKVQERAAASADSSTEAPLPKFLKRNASALYMAADACKELKADGLLALLTTPEKAVQLESPSGRLAKQLLQIVAEHHLVAPDPEKALREGIRFLFT